MYQQKYVIYSCRYNAASSSSSSFEFILCVPRAALAIELEDGDDLDCDDSSIDLLLELSLLTQKLVYIDPYR